MDPKSKAFIELRKKWYERLRTKGFDDIEQEDGRLKVWSTSRESSEDGKGLREAKEEYYRLAGQFSYDYNFACTRDRIVWLRHAEGISIRNIVILLAKKGIKTNRRTVHETIDKLRAIMLKGLGTDSNE